MSFPSVKGAVVNTVKKPNEATTGQPVPCLEKASVTEATSDSDNAIAVLLRS